MEEKAPQHLVIRELDPLTNEEIQYHLFMGFLQLTALSNAVFKYLGETVIPRNNPNMKEKIASLYTQEDPASVLLLLSEEDISTELTDSDKNILSSTALLILKPFLCQYEALYKYSDSFESADLKYRKLFLIMSPENGELVSKWVEKHLDDFFTLKGWKALKFQERTDETRR